MGTLIDRVHRELTAKTSSKLPKLITPGAVPAEASAQAGGDTAKSRHSGGGRNPERYQDIPGFCKSAKLDDIRGHNYILTPGRYVGAAEVEDDGEPFEDKMSRLTAELKKQMEEGAKLDKQIWQNLKEIGYGK